jgi:16S rRNA (guanine966-N2)-methyltransferase
VRIIAGSRKGHTIYAPKGMDTRPTGDRVREAAFNLIGPVDGASVLDLYAGSGAMGLEALSRGADRAVFVESGREACRGIERNLEQLRLTGARVVCDDVLRFLASGRGSYDLILVDPPYELVESLQMRLSLYLPALLEPDGLLVFETSARDEPELPLAKRTSRRYGSARLTLFEHSSRSSGAAGGSGPEGIVLRTDPESTEPPAASGDSVGRLRRLGGVAGEGREA